MSTLLLVCCVATEMSTRKCNNLINTNTETESCSLISKVESAARAIALYSKFFSIALTLALDLCEMHEYASKKMKRIMSAAICKFMNVHGRMKYDAQTDGDCHQVVFLDSYVQLHTFTFTPVAFFHSYYYYLITSIYDTDEDMQFYFPWHPTAKINAMCVYAIHSFSGIKNVQTNIYTEFQMQFDVKSTKHASKFLRKVITSGFNFAMTFPYFIL